MRSIVSAGAAWLIVEGRHPWGGGGVTDAGQPPGRVAQTEEG